MMRHKTNDVNNYYSSNNSSFQGIQMQTARNFKMSILQLIFMVNDAEQL
jgi:hypothetical protein